MLKNVMALIGTLALALVGFLLLYGFTGQYNVAATTDHSTLVKYSFDTLSAKSIEARAADLRPIELPSAETGLTEGFDFYEKMCVTCHGAAGTEPSAIGDGLAPPARLLGESGESFDAAEFFWVIKYGIKFTGMPAFSPTHSDEEILAVTAFVQQLPELSEADYQEMRSRHRASPRR